jgi:purine-binding chemotaxis protein CheW
MSAELPKQMIIFLLDNEAFALDVTIVQEILPETATRKIPGAASYFSGVFDFRGQIIPLLSLRELLTLPPETEIKNVIVVKHQDKLLGLAVDGVLEVLTGQSDLKVMQPRGLRVPMEFVQGVTLVNEMVVVVLNIDKLAAAVASEEG